MDKRTRKRRDTQAAIFDAAMALIELQGYDDTSVQEICESAGVGRATFFRYFETKAGLLREHNRRLTDVAARRVAELGPVGASAQLQAVAAVIGDSWAAAGPGIRRLGRDAPGFSDPTGMRTHPELIDLTVQVVSDGLAADDLRTELPAPTVAGRLGRAAIMGACPTPPATASTTSPRT